MEVIPDIFKVERGNDVVQKEFEGFTVYLKNFDYSRFFEERLI